MSQHGINFSASDPSGSALLDTLLPNFQEDVRTNHSGTSRPSYVVAGMMWIDNTTNPWVLKLFNGTNDIILGNADTSGLTFTPSAGADLLSDTTPQLGGFLDPNSNYIGCSKGADLASSATLIIGTDGDFFNVTGTTNISAMTVAANRKFTLKFNDVLTVAHGASLSLPGGVDFTTAAGDVLVCQTTATNTVLVINVTKADGTAVVAPAAGAHVKLGTLVLSGDTAGTVTGLVNGVVGIKLIVRNLRLSDANGNLQLRFGAGGFANNLNTNIYQYRLERNNTGSTSYSAESSNSLSYIKLASAVSNSDGSYGGVEGFLYMYLNPVGYDKHVSGQMNWTNSSGNMDGGVCKGKINTNSTITGFELSASSGTISGTVDIYYIV